MCSILPLSAHFHSTSPSPAPPPPHQAMSRMIRSLRPYGEFPTLGGRAEELSYGGEWPDVQGLVGRKDKGKGRAVEEERAGGKATPSADPATLPSESSAPPILTSASFDPRAPSFNPSSFPLPSSSPSLRRKYRPLDLNNPEEPSPDPSALDAATLLPLLEAALDEADSLRQQLALAEAAPPSVSVASSSSFSTAAHPDVAALKAEVVAAKEDLDVAREELSFLRSEADRVPTLEGEVRRLVDMLTAAKRERDIARVQLGRSLPPLSSIGTNGGVFLGRPGGTTPPPPRPQQSERPALTQVTDERDTRRFELTAAQAQLSKLRGGGGGDGSNGAATASEVRWRAEKNGMVKRWEKVRESLEEAVARERRGREEAEEKVKELERHLTEAIIAVASKSSPTEGAESGKLDWAEEVSLQHQLDALNLSHATLSTRLDDFDQTKEELTECLKVLDELMVENEELRKEKGAIEGELKECRRREEFGRR